MLTPTRPTPAADRSYLGHYGLVGNPWAVWLLGQQSEMLADDASLFGGERVTPPDCPAEHPLAPLARYKMRWRPGFFKCYQHEPPVEISIEPRFDPAPDFDALKSTGKMLDYVWDDAAGCYAVVEIRDG